MPLVWDITTIVQSGEHSQLCNAADFILHPRFHLDFTSYETLSGLFTSYSWIYKPGPRETQTAMC